MVGLGKNGAGRAFARRMFRRTIFAALIIFAVTAVGGYGVEAVHVALHDGLAWADVNYGGNTLHFVVDTGAASSCINLAVAKRLGVRLGSPLTVAGVGGETTGYRCTGFHASVGRLGGGGDLLPETVVALDLSGPSRACSEKIDGLIGADFFRGKVMRIDYARGVLSRVEGLPAGGIETPLRFSNGVMCAPVAVEGGRAQWTRLDTGCTDALDWCGGVCCRSKGAEKSVALASFSRTTTLAEVTVGTARLHDLPVILRKREIFPGEAGLLGNAALSRYRVTIDGIGNRLVLEPVR